MTNFKVGDIVQLRKEPNINGVLTEVDYDDKGEVVSCKILWDDAISGYLDIQWCYKLIRV